MNWLVRLFRRRYPSTRRLLAPLLSQVLPPLHRRMLEGLMALEQATVNDIMIPRQAVAGIDLDEGPADVLRTLRTTQHTRLPVYRGDLNQTVGILHMRNASKLLGQEDITADDVLKHCRTPYYLPERTALATQLMEFQKQRRRLGLVVDEYGDVQGIVTLESILEELIGEFTTRPAEQHPDIALAADGRYDIEGSASLRTINRSLDWQLPLHGARTLNGLVLETLEHMPNGPLCIRLEAYDIEVVSLRGHLVRLARVSRRAPD